METVTQPMCLTWEGGLGPFICKTRHTLVSFVYKVLIVNMPPYFSDLLNWSYSNYATCSSDYWCSLFPGQTLNLGRLIQCHCCLYLEHLAAWIQTIEMFLKIMLEVLPLYSWHHWKWGVTSKIKIKIIIIKKNIMPADLFPCPDENIGTRMLLTEGFTSSPEPWE